ncbi:hypothetical protein UT300005_03530 [Clostridium sp. CTA-5]
MNEELTVNSRKVAEMTGKKGILFTATYVTKFEEWKSKLSQVQFKYPKRKSWY